LNNKQIFFAFLVRYCKITLPMTTPDHQTNQYLERIPQSHDRRRLQRFAAAILQHTNTDAVLSLEGQPLYANANYEEGDPRLHTFSYSVLLPALMRELASMRRVRFDVLFDEFTVEHDLANPHRTLQEILHTLQTPQALLKIATPALESQQVRAGEQLLATLEDRGAITSNHKQEKVLRPHFSDQEIALTTHGRLRCAILDAAYQWEKSQHADVHVIQHSTDFTRQQQEMLTILRTFAESTQTSLPIFAYLFSRIRKGQERLAAVRLIFEGNEEQREEIT
jgi:hypothetical protein